MTSNNSFRTLFLFATFSNDFPFFSEKSTFNIEPAALLAVLIFKSDSSDITPVDKLANIISKFALSSSTKF